MAEIEVNNHIADQGVDLTYQGQLPYRVKVGKMIVEVFPPGWLSLNKELASGYHTSLCIKLANHPVDELYSKLAEIATHCSVILDEIYSPEELDKLAAILAGRLQVLREAVHEPITVPTEH